MKLKNKIAALSTLFILHNFGVTTAASIDDELAVIAAEQNNPNEKVETFDPESTDSKKNKSRDEIKAEEKRLEKEREEARKKIKEERKKSRDELTGKTPLSKNPAPIERKPDSKPTITPTAESVQAVKAAEENPADNIPAVQIPVPVQIAKENPVQPPNVSLPNPILTYSTFNDIVQALNFTPLYVPKKFGYTITSMLAINDSIAEIRYNRKWEPNIALHVRTYRRTAGEELHDISGVTGVKWRVNVVSGITVYIAKINETKNVAAWAVGNYTFSAYVENMAFAAFHSLVSDELVDLSNHYYLVD